MTVQAIPDTYPIYEFWSVDVQSLATFADPLADDVWTCGLITMEDVINCPDISKGRRVSGQTPSVELTREYHIARIAYLAANGWEENPNEQIMVYSPENYHELITRFAPDDFSPAAIRNRQRVRITDGNHRFCAALLTGQKTLNIEPYGDVEYLRLLLNPTPAPFVS